jgi:quinohemoprotein ethanol dehydrogenase
VRALVFAIAFAVAGCGNPGASVEARGPAADNWLGHNGGEDESSFSLLEEINTNTIGDLGLAWSLDLSGETYLEATPLAIDGILYFTGAMSAVYAVDARSGKMLWQYDPEIWNHDAYRMNRFLVVNRGLAYEDGRLFLGAFDGRLICLDAKTGAVIWSEDTLPDGSFHAITGAPRTFDGKVIIGNGGADQNERGFVTAYEAATGRQLWRFYTVPGDPEINGDDPAMRLAASTWAKDSWKKTGGGGTVWDSITYDSEFNRIYIGVGNSGPYDPEERDPGGGDNLFLVSIVALDADTGRYIWHYQMNPREAWDYKATTTMITATLNIDGVQRKVLMQSPSNGFFYVLDRTDGKLISAEKTGRVDWAERIDLETGRPVERENIRYETGETTLWPSPAGTHNWQSMAYNPNTGLVYIPYIHLGATFRSMKASTDGLVLGGLSIKLFPDPEAPGQAALLAWDPVAQKERWRYWQPSPWNGAVMTTAGNLVFQGDADGEFAAFDAESGSKVWSFDAKLGIVAAPISYRASGQQYVSVLVGYGGGGQISNLTHRGYKYGVQPRRLLTFRLGGDAELPETPPKDFTVNALDDPSLEIDVEQAEAGARTFAVNRCAACHGARLVSLGALGPDLRESAIALNRESFGTLLREGTLLPNGMPRFEELSEDEITGLFMYIRAGARDVVKAAQAVDAPPAAGGL